jgi:hypothetical protein
MHLDGTPEMISPNRTHENIESFVTNFISFVPSRKVFINWISKQCYGSQQLLRKEKVELKTEIPNKYKRSSFSKIVFFWRKENLNVKLFFPNELERDLYALVFLVGSIFPPFQYPHSCYWTLKKCNYNK